LERTEKPSLSLFINRSGMGEKALNLALSERLIKKEVKAVDPKVVVGSQRYILTKKRRYVRGTKKWYVFHAIRAITSFISKDERWLPLLNIWVEFLVKPQIITCGTVGKHFCT